MSALPWNDVRNAMKGDDGKVRVPDGWYDCKIASTKAGRTGSGYEKINARFVVLAGPYEGGSIFMDFIVTVDKPGGLSLLGERLAALGISEDMLHDSLQMTDLAALMVGKTVQLRLATRIFNEKEYDDVKSMKPLAGSGGGFAFGESSPYAAPVLASTPVPGLPVPPSMPDSTPVPAGFSTLVPGSPAGDELPPEPPF